MNGLDDENSLRIYPSRSVHVDGDSTAACVCNEIIVVVCQGQPVVVVVVVVVVVMMMTINKTRRFFDQGWSYAWTSRGKVSISKPTTYMLHKPSELDAVGPLCTAHDHNCQLLQKHTVRALAQPTLQSAIFFFFFFFLLL
jgi:hypothetical protein